MAWLCCQALLATEARVHDLSSALQVAEAEPLPVQRWLSVHPFGASLPSAVKAKAAPGPRSEIAVLLQVRDAIRLHWQMQLGQLVGELLPSKLLRRPQVCAREPPARESMATTISGDLLPYSRSHRPSPSPAQLEALSKRTEHPLHSASSHSRPKDRLSV